MGTGLNPWSNAHSCTQLAPLLGQSLCHCQQLLMSLLCSCPCKCSSQAPSPPETVEQR